MVRTIALVLAAAAAAGQPWRPPTAAERPGIDRALGAYGARCWRDVRVARVDRRYASATFGRLPLPKGCSLGNGQVLLVRVAPRRWVQEESADEWDCRILPPRVLASILACGDLPGAEGVVPAPRVLGAVFAAGGRGYFRLARDHPDWVVTGRGYFHLAGRWHRVACAQVPRSVKRELVLECPA